jgi:type I restriction enzyme S subunit
MESQSLFGELYAKKNDNELLDASSLPQLPESWRWTTIGRIGQVKGGKRLPQGHSYSSTRTQYPYLRVVDFENFRIREDDLKYLTAQTHGMLMRYTISKDDVYISIAGTVGAVGVVPDHLHGAHLTENAAKIVLQSTEINQNYLCYWLASPYGKSFIASSTIATTQPKLALFRIERIPFPFAPRPVQDQIVSEIEKQFTRLEAGVAGLRHVQSNLKRYRAAVLKAACEGKLVPTEAGLARQEGCTYETGAQLLERILTERRQKWNGKGKYKEPAKPDPATFPEPPEGWTLIELGQLAWSIKDGPHYSPKYIRDGIPFITGGNVRPSGVDFENAKRISAELHAELSKRCRPEYGDILYTKGGTTGIARVNTYHEEFNVWVHVAVLKLVQSLEPFFVQHMLNSPSCYMQARRFTHGVGNQDLGLTRMVHITFPLPPLAEQKRIIAEVDRRLSVVEELEAVVTANVKRATRLHQSILQCAFAGNL